LSVLPHRPLGTSGISVSRLALGSWRTYERIPRDQGVAVMRAARELGIDFLDDARYDDETGTAPIRTGYSELVFGEIFRASGWRRDDVVVSNKLWWEFWPSQSADEEIDGSLERMGFDHLDLVYSCPSSNEPPVEEVVEAVGGLIASGKARAWGVCNWRPDRLAEAAEIARREGVPPPCAAQLPYSLTVREHVDGPAAVDAIRAAGVAVVASFVLSGGILSGKYTDRSAAGRMSGELDDAHSEAALRAANDLRALADRLDAKPAALAIAFAAEGPNVASVLFGATTPEQLAENVAAIDLLERLTPAELSDLRAIGSEA
jgi:aryl-alcohol dehydrogenase-like predicted oxidoreductase